MTPPPAQSSRGNGSGATRRSARRARERARHRQEIIDAARAVIAARGLDGLTVEEVARRAEFAVGSIYRYFQSKENLVDAVLAELAMPYLEEIEQIVATEQPFEVALGAFLDTFAAHPSEHLPVLQLLSAFPGEASQAETRRRVHEAGRRHFRAVRSMVERGSAEGALSGADPEWMTTCLIAMVAGFTRRAIYGDDIDLSRAAEVIRRAFLYGFGTAKGSW